MTHNQRRECQLVITDKKLPLTSSNVQIRIIQLSDHDEVLNFLRTHYYKEEPLTIGSEPKEQDPEDEKFNMSQIAHGTCLLAVQQIADDNEDSDIRERVVGVLISGPKDQHEAEHLFEEAARFGPTKWGIALKFLARAEENSNVYERYSVTKALHIHILAVDTNLRGRSIGVRLVDELKRLGRQLDYPLLTLDCTSYYSAKLCERLGMDCVNVEKYQNYLDNEGKPIFRPPPPHKCLKTFAMRL
ncbi:arylalkylamine N-acetyltransferase 1-like [Anastrepha ludens]|uniref:arylalkylamine N-acetyltransferase 1-like n=1 Tax=Anastrepha ludens TaxID=28586 RepID=UPI0023AEFF2F|nr:arylalkylamine N-acetyltransferase 1-like [Anastrepha ludens]